MELEIHPTAMAICRLDPSADAPVWAAGATGPLLSITWTRDEVSVVAPEWAVPRSVRCERGWRAMSVRGPLAFSLTGVLAALSAPLANAGVPIFVVSTFETDWLLVRAGDLGTAVEVLGEAGHRVTATSTDD